MAELATIRVRRAWIKNALEESGGIAGLADRLGCQPSTISRQARGLAEAGPRFIAAVMRNLPVEFSDAFEVADRIDRGSIKDIAA